jgi:hypothetical protein
MVKLLATAQPYAVDPSTASSFEFAKAICDGEPRRMSELVPDGPGARARRAALRGDLDAIAAKALRKDCASRYQTASELDEDLFRHLSLLPVQARRGALNYRFGRWLLKHRAFAGAAIVSNVVLLVGITITIAQVHEARTQRERANRNFTSVRTLTNDFLFDLNDAIAPLPGSRPARKLVVEKAQLYLKTLAAEADADPSLDFDLAVSYHKLGDLLAMPTAPNLGDIDGALASYAQSVRLLQAIAGRGGAEADRARMELARTWLSQASVLSFNTRFDRAEQALRESEGVLQDLARRRPADVDVQKLQASCNGGLSWVRHERGDMAGFEQYAARSEALLERVIAAHPDNADALFRLQTAYARRASSYLDRDGTAESARLALGFAQKWQDVGRRLLAHEPQNPRYRAVMAESSGFVGAAYDRLGDPRRADEALQLGLSQLAEELRLDPNDDSALDQMMNLQVTLAKVKLDEHDAEAAREHAAQAMAFYRRRSEAAQANSYNLLAVAQAHHLTAHAWLQTAALARARPEAAGSARAKACSEFDASMAVVRRVKEVPETSSDGYDIGEATREAAECRRATRPAGSA